MLPHVMSAVMDYVGSSAWLPCALICRETMHKARHCELCAVSSRMIVSRSPAMMKWCMSIGIELRDISLGATQHDTLCGTLSSMAWLHTEMGHKVKWDVTSLRIILRSCNIALLEWLIKSVPGILCEKNGGSAVIVSGFMTDVPDLVGDYIQGAHKLHLDIRKQTYDLLRLKEFGIIAACETFYKAERLGPEIRHLIEDIFSEQLPEALKFSSFILNFLVSESAVLRYTT